MASSAIRNDARNELSAEQATNLGRGRAILRAEADVLRKVADALDESFCHAVDAIVCCPGNVIVTGMGKAGIIGRKLSASFSSTGTPSHFLHPAEAVHGDLGSLRQQDIVVVLSYSGETGEVTRLLPTLRQTTRQLIAITARTESTLGAAADIVLPLGKLTEACALGLAPSTSTTAMLALGDALALVASERVGFTPENFAMFHPAGSLGQKLTGVCEVMRPLSECRVAHETLTLRQVIVEVSRTGRRTGAIMLTDHQDRLSGIFTDSDLARLLEKSQDSRLDERVSEVMSRQFCTIDASRRLPEAMELLASKKISELPVVDEQRRPVGMIDVTDIVGVISQGTESNASTSTSTRSSSAGYDGGVPRIIPLREFDTESSPKD